MYFCLRHWAGAVHSQYSSGSFGSSLKFRPHVDARSERMSYTYLREKAAFQRLVLLLEKSVIALVKKRVFPTPKQMPYAINGMFAIAVAYICSRIFRDFFF